MNALRLLLLAALALPVAAPAEGPAPANASPQPPDLVTRFSHPDAWVHDPSTIVKCDNEYWLFFTGWGVPSLRSTNRTDWRLGPPVFSSPPAWTANTIPGNRGHFWAPDVIRLGDRYLLYYSVSIFGKNTSVIGLATTPTLNPGDSRYHWSDEGPVIESKATNDFNTIDPSVFHDVDGKLWLVFGSYWKGIKLVELDPRTGKRLAPDAPLYSLAWHDSIEASYLYRHGGYYYLFVNWGQCCRGVDSTYSIRVGRAEKVTGPYRDQAGKDLLQDGASPFLQTTGDFIGPGHAGIFSDPDGDWLSCHFYDGTWNGAATLAILPLRWTTNGWPEVNVGR